MRKRSHLVLLAALTIALGLASRRFPALFPSMLGKYPGDALYAVLVYWLVAFARPGTSPPRCAVVATAFCFAIEFLQLWQQPLLKAVRSTTLGHLVLGSSFGALDLVAYVAGTAAACAVEVVVQRTRRDSRRGSHRK